MTNAETPAENTGGTTATSIARALAELPDKTRVHVLAKLLGTSSREVLATLAQLGHTARSPQSGVAKDVALRVAEVLGAIEADTEPGADDTEAPAGAPEGEPPEAVSAIDTASQPVTGQAAESSASTERTTTGQAVTGEPDSAADTPSRGTDTSPGRGPAPRGSRQRRTSRARAAASAEAPEPTGEPTSSESPAAPASSGRPTSPGSPPVLPPATQPPAAPPAHTPVFAAPSPVFLPPEPVTPEPTPTPAVKEETADEASEETSASRPSDDDSSDGDGGSRRRRRRGRRGRGRGKGGDDAGDSTDTGTDEQHTNGAERADSTDGASTDESPAQSGSGGEQPDQSETESASKRRRRRRRRKSGDDDGNDTSTSSSDDPPNTVVHVRDSKPAEEKDGRAEDGVRSVRGSTRLEAKRQRRRDGREAGRRRAPILSEAEFLARRESVERAMVVAERGDSTQIGVLEDGVLVEHFVTSSGSGSIVGNVYLGRVQNVLPSMEAAFIDIGRGRNAVLYAGEVDWDAAGLEGKARKIEQALSTGDHVLVQVTKDPVGHKGARLTTQISLPGRFLVYVPSGGATGISRKLPENERRRLKDILKRIVPSDAGVIIRTASEGISEEELDRDVRRLKAQWEVIKERANSAGAKKSGAPALLYEEPDLLVKVVRDLFTEDFGKLEIQGLTAWETIRAYVEHVAPDLLGRVKRYVGTSDVFSEYRIDEQLMKALDRKVWLPSGGYLVIDRTEAMTVIDVNTGKFTGSGGNLEETVTRNNLESAEEIVRQLRLRDIGGIIVIDFIDMVLESNRELVLRRLTECLGRDRTRHQVAEVTSLGLVQMTRKRVGTGLLEAFSTTCEHCKGRGVIVSSEPQKGNGGGHGNGGNGHGGQQGSRRSRNKAKVAAEQEAAKPAESTGGGGPTPEQRESAVSAVQAMANASKVATKPAEADASDDAERVTEQSRSRSGGGTKKQTRDGAGERVAERSTGPVGVSPDSDPRNRMTAPVGPDEAQPAPAAQPAPSTPPAGSDNGQSPAPTVRTATRRPRRAASRPAGPPVRAHDDG